MSKRGPPLSKKAQYAAVVLKNDPALGIRKAMVRAGYTKEESEKDRTTVNVMSVCASTIRYKVNKGEIGESLKRPGPVSSKIIETKTH